MPRYVPRGPIEAHKLDNETEYVILEGGSVLGMLDADLFERVFTREGAGISSRGAAARALTPGLQESMRRSYETGYSAAGVVDPPAGEAEQLEPDPEAAEVEPELDFDRDQARVRNGALRRAQDRIRADGPVGTPLEPEDLVPGAVKLEQAIAARTTAGGPGGRLPRAPEDVERAIAETREVVRRESEARQGLGSTPDDPNGGKPYGYRLKAGESAGRGRRVCVRKLASGELCHTVNPLKSKDPKCWGCGKPVKVAKR